MTLDLLYSFVLSLYGIPYQWGGDGPDSFGNFGFDCSGLVQAILKKAGITLPRRLDANELYQLYSNEGHPYEGKGAIAFFGLPARVSHCGWMIDNKIMISAAGGGPGCTSMQNSRLANANVKIQPVEWYKIPPYLGAWSPYYGF